MQRRVLIVCAALAVLTLVLVYSSRERATPTMPPIATAPASARTQTSDARVVLPDIPQPSVVDAANDVAAATARAAVDTPPRPLVLAGVVVDVAPGENGARTPVPGVKVSAELGFLGSALPPSTVTDERGRFRIELADTGKRPLSFALLSDPGEHHRHGSATLKMKEGEFDALDLVLERFPNGDLVGTTVDASGDTVAHVQLVFAPGDGTRRETTSDEHGQFRVENLRALNVMTAKRAGYVLLQAQRPKERKQGGWEDMRVVLASAGRLRVSVRDAHDQPVAGAHVGARLSAVEHFGPKRNELGYTSRAWPASTTDESGVAVLDSVWAGQRLEIDVRPRPSTLIQAARESDGVLQFGRSATGLPIVVAPGAELALRAVTPSTQRITGRVEDPAGAAVPEASIGLTSIDPERMVPVLSRSHDNGRFVLEFPSVRAGDPLLLTATVDGQAFGAPQPSMRFAARVFEWSGSDAMDVVLVLSPPLAISGRVVDGDRKPVRGFVYAYEDREPKLHVGARGANIIGKEGVFVVSGLLAGTYDLRVRAGGRWAETWVENVEAGRSGLEIRVDRERPARVTIETVLRGGEPAELVVLQKRVDPRAETPDAPLLPSDAVYATPTGWPSDLAGMATGGGGDFSLTPMKENPTTLLLDEGCYWLGARARDKDGRFYFPIGTGRVRVDVGEHRLRFELTPAVRVEGRVHASNATDLAVAIAWKDGELLELDGGYGDLDAVRELGANGYFAFELVPVGDHELWVGTSDELRARMPRHRQKITVKRERMAFVDVIVGG